jgi:hypothetical protein
MNTVESSTFSSEIVAIRSAVDLIKGLRYKLRMFVIPIEGPSTDIFCDNEAVTKSYGIPESTLEEEAPLHCLSQKQRSSQQLRQVLRSGLLRKLQNEILRMNLQSL